MHKSSTRERALWEIQTQICTKKKLHKNKSERKTAPT